ncbi:MAG: purine-nucleoside phosphorylase [Clostridia bacterium]|nr:purine-nucleoside phosphorylase [Clostridia bacterium]MBP3651840.1 purine-nucleoside phosphorylase [Clostridia bacterium]
MSNIPTPHINAKLGDFAKTVLMPGDPLRAKYIAENYLEDAVLVNNVRGVQGYTGYYKGKRVSVMASGMGMPSIGIYSYELFNYYGVENIIRVGSAGAMSDKLKLRDVVAGMSAYTNSNYGYQFGFDGTLAPCCSYELLTKAVAAGEKLGQSVVPGPVFSSDAFYEQGGYESAAGKLMKLGVLCVEMEAYALYLNAAAAGKNALALLTISDSIVTGEALPAEDRQNTFTKMMEIALEIA